MRLFFLLTLLAASIAGVAACAADPISSSYRGKRAPIDDDSDSADDKARAANYERDGSVYDSAASENSGLGILRFMPNIINTGIDGEHTFKVPVAVYDANEDDDLEVTVSDPTAVSIVKTALAKTVNESGAFDRGSYYMVTVLKAVPITLTASSNGHTATARINVTSYDTARWSAGETRYKNGNANVAGNPPCTRCHVDGRAIDHSPAALASARDSEVGYIITNGMKPGPVPITGVDCADCSDTGKKHQWTVTDDEREGLITYLRSLEPRGFK